MSQSITLSLRRALAATAVGTLLLTLPGCGNTTPAPAASSTPGGNVAATVNGEPVSQDELNAELNRLHGREVLRKVVDDKLIQQAAKKDNITVSDAEVKRRMDELKGSPQYAALQRGTGMTDAEMEVQVRKAVTLQLLILTEIKETEKLAMYDQYREQLEKAHVYHVLLGSKGDADKALAALKGGKPFEAVAKEMSKDTGTKDLGGDLGWVSRPMIPDESMRTTVFTIAENTLSDPVKSQAGFHIVKVTARRKSYDDLKGDIQDTLSASRQENYLQRLRVKAEVKTRYDNATPAPAAAAAASPSPAATH